MEEVMKLEINRGEWLRGDKDNSYLLRSSDGLRCCLGILGRALSIPDSDMEDEGEPWRGSGDTEPVWPDWLATPVNWVTLTDEQRVIRINDDPAISDEWREKELTTIFARHDVELAFVDGPAPEWP